MKKYYGFHKATPTLFYFYNFARVMAVDHYEYRNLAMEMFALQELPSFIVAGNVCTLNLSCKTCAMKNMWYIMYAAIIVAKLYLPWDKRTKSC